MNNAQFTFNFQEITSFALEDFIQSEANIEAFQTINNWQNWKEGKYDRIIFVYGPSNSGKTHLSHIFANYTKAKFISVQDLFTKSVFELTYGQKSLILEDIENLKDCEEFLFHLINEVSDNKIYFFISSKLSPKELSFKLADLNSRICSIPSVKINQPDDKLIETLLLKRFSDKQIRISDELLHYIVNRLERSFSAINRFVDYVDKKSIIEKKKANFSLVKQILEYMENIKT